MEYDLYYTTGVWEKRLVSVETIGGFTLTCCIWFPNISCQCSLAHSLNLLKSLGRDELQRLFDEQESVTVTCEYCRQAYRIDQEHGRMLIEQLANRL